MARRAFARRQAAREKPDIPISKPRRFMTIRGFDRRIPNKQILIEEIAR